MTLLPHFLDDFWSKFDQKSIHFAQFTNQNSSFFWTVNQVRSKKVQNLTNKTPKIKQKSTKNQPNSWVWPWRQTTKKIATSFQLPSPASKKKHMVFFTYLPVCQPPTTQVSGIIHWTFAHKQSQNSKKERRLSLFELLAKQELHNPPSRLRRESAASDQLTQFRNKESNVVTYFPPGHHEFISKEQQPVPNQTTFGVKITTQTTLQERRVNNTQIPSQKEEGKWAGSTQPACSWQAARRHLPAWKFKHLDGVTIDCHHGMKLQ